MPHDSPKVLGVQRSAVVDHFSALTRFLTKGGSVVAFPHVHFGERGELPVGKVFGREVSFCPAFSRYSHGEI